MKNSFIKNEYIMYKYIIPCVILYPQYLAMHPSHIMDAINLTDEGNRMQLEQFAKSSSAFFSILYS